ncbi:DUF554 domain-containing protein [Megasphaera hominis]|jgi:uncharacterized membrane protein YqgA involved in biofilm formation|uniref:DUF554 domain-containing protein n=1 Tax=Megasphaera hominis TaxID=159836 RepID=A0ABR6VFT0_9FIRM|nr:DUF554 domain-containing protein [Megasphaera hominis]MBC3536099.1 DUF554 domain-containing protein [Megasphaera hominis]
MIAIIINGVTASLGALLGFFLKRGISEKYTKAIFGVISLCVAIMGVQSAVQSQNLLLVLASLIVGTLLGTIIGIEDRMQQFGEFLKRRMQRPGEDNTFVKGFVTLSVMQVVGALAILGPIQAALGSNDLLYFKSVLDFTSAFIFGTIYGLGVVPVGLVNLVYEAFFFLLASFFMPLMTPDVIRELNAVGGVMILGIALNMFRVTELKVADFLPALFIPILYYHLFV